MKKFQILLATCTAILACACCGQYGASESPYSHNTDTMRITAVLPHDDLGYWTSVADGMRLAETELPVDLKISLPSVNYSVPQMIELIKAATAARVDAIVVQGVSDTQYIAALTTAAQQDIQIIFADTDLPDFPKHLYVGTDNYTAGKMLGERAAQETGGQAVIGIISGAPGYPNLELRLQGLRDAIAPYPGMRVERVEYNQYDSLTMVEKYEALSDPALGIDTLLCIEGTSAMTMSGMQKERAPGFRCVIGFDDSKESRAALAEDLVDGLILQQSQRMGYLSVAESYKYITDGSYSHEIIHTATTYVTAEDLNEEGNYETP